MPTSIFESNMRALLVVSAVFFLICPPSLNAQESDETRRWEFNTSREVLASSNIEGAEITEGSFIGKTKYDPNFTLFLPAGGIDAARYTRMRVRMFSSAPADAIAIYYKDEGDDWALGAGPAILQGWHEYEFDLNTNLGWKGGDAGREEARVWGGPNKRVKLLRLDPGNQADREVKIDWIEILADLEAPPPALATESQLKTAPPVETILPPQNTWRWKSDGDLAGWTGTNLVHLEARSGVLRGLTKYDPTLLVPQPLQFEAREYSSIEFKVKSDLSGRGEIYFTRKGEGFTDQRVLRTSLVGDSQWHVYRVKMADSSSWSGLIDGLRFDPLNAAGANLEVEYLRLLPADDGNLIANGGFELADPDHAQRPESWIVAQGRGELTTRPEGGSALRLSGDPAKITTIATGYFENLTVDRHQFAFEYQCETAATAEVTIAFQSAYGEPLPPVKLTIPLIPNAAWQNVPRAITIPERAAQMGLTFQVKGSTMAQLDNVVLKPLGVPDMITEAPSAGKPSWQASWIAAPDAPGKGAAPRYFRKSFPIADPAQVKSARVLLTADRVARLWINGKQLPGGPFCETWSIADVYDIAPLLQKGENVIGLQTWNEDGPEGAIAEIGIHTADQETQFFVTDASWKSKAGEAPANWASAAFSAADWSASQAVAEFSDGPWGNSVDYLYLGPLITLGNIHFSIAESAAPGETVPWIATFTPDQIPTRPVSLELELSKPDEPGVLFWTQRLDTSQWKAGTPVTVGPVPVTLPRHTAPGDYQVRLRVPDTTLIPGGDFITNLTGEEGPPAGGDTLAKAFTLQPLRPIKTPVAKIKYLHKGQVPALEINGETHPVTHMMHGNAEKKLIRLTRENGVNLIWLNFERGFGWNQGGPYDFSDLDRTCADLLNQYPEAYLVLNVPLDSVYNPGMRQWNAQNPDELVKDHEGSTRIGGYSGSTIEAPSYSSRVWLKDASDAWRALIRHVRSRSIGERVIGYVPISGISWEWFYWGAQSRDFVDYSKPARDHFQRWALAKYGEIAKANTAWKSTYANFEAIEIPTKEERLATDELTFLDPQKSRRLIDFHEFFSDVISGSILQFCKVVKEESKGESLTGTYYGYNMQVISSYLAQHTGHMALHKIVQSPEIDFLMSPSRYDDRGIGGGSGFMMTVDSIKLHGKYYIDQADIRTVNATGASGQLARLSTLRESIATHTTRQKSAA